MQNYFTKTVMREGFGNLIAEEMYTWSKSSVTGL